MNNSRLVTRLPSLLARALSRQTSGGRFVPEVDGLRFLAIGSVLLFHIGGFALHHAEQAKGPTPDWLTALIAPGYVGVQIFFAISGLILGLPFARARLAGGPAVTLKAYFLRRLTRLEPPYLVSLLLWTMLLVTVKGMSLISLLPHLGASALYLHGLIYGTPSVINGVAWSLEVEVQFYLLAPLLALIFAVRSAFLRRAAIAVGVVAGSAFQHWLSHPSANNPLMGLSLAHQLHWFLIGFLVADLLVSRWREDTDTIQQSAPLGTRGKLLIDSVGLAALIALWWLLQPDGRPIWMAHLIGPWCVLAMLVAAFRGRVWRWFLTRPPIYLIGGMCYTIYLYHPLFKTAVGNAARHWSLGSSVASQVLAHVLLIGGVTLVVSAILFVLVERPFMRPLWRKRA